MTPSQLLMPRYIVTAEDTSGDFKAGGILILHQNYNGYKNILTGEFHRIEQIAKFPHLFRLLHWSEYREVEQMPEYIKCEIDCRIPKGTILKAKWESFTGSIVYRNCNPQFYIIPEYFSPATQEEYIQYQQIKVK